MSPEQNAACLIAAELLTYGREVQALAEKYRCPELLRLADQILAGATDVIVKAEPDPDGESR